MNKEFVSYEQAMELKDLGFDEPCLRQANQHGHTMWRFISTDGVTEALSVEEVIKYPMHESMIGVPTFQQAFDWVREKHNLISAVWQCGVSEQGKSSYEYMIDTLHNLRIGQFVQDLPFKTYEDAQIACLDALIEIIREEKKYGKSIS